MIETQPTYDELLTRVARLEREVELQRGTALASGGESSRANEALDQARATLTAIIESTEDLIWAVDAQHFGLLMFNHGLRDYFLRQRGMAVALGQRPEDLLPTEEFVRVWREYYGRALRDGPYMTEYAVYGGTRTLELSFNLMIREGRAFGVSVFGRDITERKSAEEALRKSEQKFRQITEESPVAIYIIQGGQLVYVNPSLAKQAGYSREEIVGKLAPQELVHRNDVARLMTTLGERAAGRIQGEGVEYRGIRKDGSIVHIEAYGMLMEYQGKPAVMGTLIDVSARKRAEERLQEGEDFLSFALATARTGAWDLDLVNHSTHRSLQHDQIFGYNELLPSWTYETFLEHVIAEDRAVVDQKFRQAVATQSDWSFECRILTQAGNMRWIWAAGRHRMDDSGQPRRMAGIVQDMTERRHLEEALSGSESRLRVALAAANAGTWEWNLQTNENTWSDELWKLYGLDRLSSRASYETWRRAVHPDDRATTEAAVQNTARCGGELWVEWRVNTTDGSVRWLMSRGRPERDAAGGVARYLGIVVDITERKQMQETLRLSEEKYRNLFNNAEVGMFRTRVDGTEVLDSNEKYLEIYGLKRDEMLGRPVTAYWADPAERTVLVEKLKANGRVTDFECRMLTKNGDVKTCLTSVRLYPQQEIIEGSIIDITERKRAEEERLKLEQQLSQAQRLESLGLLAGGIAHDFNNLMSGIYGHIELALDGPLDQESATNLSRAMSSMGRARDLTRQLLTFAKGGAPVRTIGRLFPFVEECARFALSGGRAACTFHVAPDLWTCNLDQNQIGQVIGNLVINAQQAMPGAGTIRISARNARLQPSEAATLPAGDYVVVSIEDSGIGIPADALPRVFDPFFTTKETGRGLGLATCHSVMRRHEGAITAESTPGKGSAFHLYLPAARAPEGDRIQNKSKAIHRGEGRVLVMDDEKAMLDVFVAMLASMGYSVETAGDGGDAVELFAKQNESGQRFRAVLLDLTVAGGTGGREAAQALRTLDSSIPLFVTSGYAEDPVMADPASYGFKASLRKPFLRSDLSDLFEKHVLPH